MDPFHCIGKRSKSQSAFSKSSVSSRGNCKKDQSKSSGACSSRPVADSVNYIAKRTRSRAAVINRTWSIEKNTRESPSMPLEGCSNSRRKRPTGDGHKDWGSLELKHQKRGHSDNDDVEVVVLDNDDDEEEYRSGGGNGNPTFDDSDDEDLGMDESHSELSSSSTGDEEENETDAKIALGKNDDSWQSSTDFSDKDDDSEDEDFVIDKSHCESSSSSSGDEDEENAADCHIVRKRNVVGERKERFVGSRMTKSGSQNDPNIDIVPIDTSDENLSHFSSDGSGYLDDSSHENFFKKDIDGRTSCSVCWENRVAEQNKSHTGSRSGKKQKKKLKIFGQPICFDEEDDDSSTENDEGDNEDEDGISGSDEALAHNGTGGDGVQNEDRRRKEEEVGKSTKRKCVHAPKDVDQVFTALINSIWEKGEAKVVLENLSSKHNAHKEEIYPSVVEAKLPLKFSFGIEKPVIVEKSGSEKELDQLWGEFDFVLNSSEIGSFGSSPVDAKDTNVPDSELDPCALCCQGKHQVILDETIGIRCRFCSFVKLEIKYLFPSWVKQPLKGPSQQIFSSDGDANMLNEFDFQVDGADSHYSHTFAEGTVWDFIPDLRKRMYEHQCEGFEFMWKNLAGGIELEMLKKSTSSDGLGGCVISHAPGTGKTLLTIVFLKTYMKMYPDCRPVIIAPLSILLTWEEEFKKWNIGIPFHNLNDPEIPEKEISIVCGLAKRYRTKKQRRMLKLYSWSAQTSILAISYSLFEKLAGERFAKEGDKRQKILCDNLSKEIRKILLEKPGLLILDEGHTPRNTCSGIWKALKKIETERRIILSGTPFQNNFQELYNILCLVRPKFADVTQSKGKWVSLTSSIGKSSADGLEKLKVMLDPFVHVHRGSILKDNLPGMRNWDIYLRPTSLQKELLDSVKGVSNNFELEHQVALVSVHLSLLMNIKDPLFGKADSISEKYLESTRLNPNGGVKTRFLMELVRLIKPTKERVLVFSQYIEPLKIIKEQLHEHFNWTEGKEVLQMQGNIESKQRQSSIYLFNDQASDARILLASIRACSEGIQLIGASRVVLLDIVWNPSVYRQAISRAYRLGQKRFVYTYLLITSGTMEEKKYKKQAEKEEISKLVFSSRNVNDERMNALSRVPDDDILGQMVQNSKLKDIFEMVCQ